MLSEIATKFVSCFTQFYTRLRLVLVKKPAQKQRIKKRKKSFIGYFNTPKANISLYLLKLNIKRNGTHRQMDIVT